MGFLRPFGIVHTLQSGVEHTFNILSRTYQVKSKPPCSILASISSNLVLLHSSFINTMQDIPYYTLNSLFVGNAAASNVNNTL